MKLVFLLLTITISESALSANPFVVKLIDDWNKSGLIKVEQIPYLEENILNLEKTSIYDSNSSQEVQTSDEELSWFERLSKSQKDDFDDKSERMQEQFQNVIREQKKKYIETYLRWREAAKDYKENESDFKKNLVDYEKLEPKKKAVIKYKRKLKTFHIVLCKTLLMWPLKIKEEDQLVHLLLQSMRWKLKDVKEGLKTH